MSTSHSVPHGGLVCVTGASGYISSYIIEQLLEKGYKVRGVVRDLAKTEKYDHLKKLPQKEGQLEFVQADISEGKYAEILVGCDALIHTATPYIYTADDPKRDIVDPAIKGTVDAIEGAIKRGTRRVVITSSGGAMLHFPVPQGYTFTENDWNTTSSLTNNPYFYSKKLAEEEAWKLWNQHKGEVDVCVVNSLFVVGPPKTPILNSSLINIKKHLTGETTSIMPGWVGWVDVRDVAAAHILAMESSETVGRRLIACSETRSWFSMAKFLKERYPEYPIPQETEEKGIQINIDNSFSKKLGMSYRNFETMMVDTVEAFIRLGVVQDHRKK